MNRFQLAAKVLTTRSSSAVDVVGNLFGSIARGKFPSSTNKDFIPIDGNGKVFQTSDGSVNPTWLGLDSKNMQYWAYRFVSPLASVIDRTAEADTNGRIEFLDANGATVKKTNYVPKLKKLVQLFKKPNPFQTWEEFNAQQMVFCKVFGYCPVWCLKPAGFQRHETEMMINLNPYLFTPERNESYDPTDTTIEENNVILKWKGRILGKEVNVPAIDCILVKDGYLDTDDLGLPVSKIAGLDYDISNICASKEADNVLLKKKGPLGVFSYVARPDLAGVTPMKPGDKDDLQKDLSNYGLSWNQLQYVVSKNPIKWEPMSFNLRDLMTKETARQGIDSICDRFGYPAELMSGKNATYENRTSAERYFYQTVIIPFSLRRMALYNEFFKMEEYVITMDFDHLPILRSAMDRKTMSDSIQVDWEGGRLTWNECRDEMEMDRVAGMDMYYNEYLKKFPPPAQTKKIKKDVLS